MPGLRDRRACTACRKAHPACQTWIAKLFAKQGHFLWAAGSTVRNGQHTFSRALIFGPSDVNRARATRCQASATVVALTKWRRSRYSTDTQRLGAEVAQGHRAFGDAPAAS